MIRGDQVIYAVVGDFGPDKIGEMSIKAHQLFGSAVLVPGRKAKLDGKGQPVAGATPGTLETEPAQVTRNSGTPGPFLVVVFPGTSVKWGFKSVDESLKPVLGPRWRALTGAPTP